MAGGRFAPRTGERRRFGAGLAWVVSMLTVFLLAVSVSAGEREPLRWGRLHLAAPAWVDSTGWFSALDLAGRPVGESTLEAGLARALGWLSEQGYPFAEARPGSFVLRDGHVDGTVTLDPGVRARVAALVLRGATITRSSTALRIAGIRSGQPYTGTEDETAAQRLARSGLFASVGRVTLLPGTRPEDVILEVPVTEPAYTHFTGVLGTGGRNGRVTGLMDLSLRNIAGTAREAAARWEDRGDGLIRYRLHYREPWLPLVPIGVRSLL